MKRREFLQKSSIISLPIFLNGMGISALANSPFSNGFDLDDDRVLVIIQLNGGNDGLNTLIPLDQYDRLSNARSNIIIPESQVLKLPDYETGFHPVMTGMKELYDMKKVSIIQSVAYPNQNRSHFRSKDIWTSGSSAEVFDTNGWMGKYYDNRVEGFPEGYPNEDFPDPFAITIGGFVSETCQGTNANYSVAVVDPFNLNPLNSGAAGGVPNDNYGKELTFLRDSIAQSNAYAEVVGTAANMGNTLSEMYPDDNNLAQKLKIVAQLISGGLRSKVYVVDLGGFDNHANQVEGTNNTEGDHAFLLETLSTAIRAFQDDISLLGLEDRVLGMTFSEFGRRIRSNGSMGTDHGTAAPLFVFGSCLENQMIGNNPEIPEAPDPQEGVSMQYDFRSVYGSILQDWFKVPEDEIRASLYQDYQYLPILCFNIKNKEEFDTNINSSNYPNPFEQYTNITFSCENDRVRVSIFDVLGHEIRVLTDQKFNAGEHSIRFDANGLPAGNYYYRITIGNKYATKLIMKVR